MKSVHSQNFPENFFTPEEALVKQMDIIREICSATLSIRKRFNLRARLPLAKLVIIGEKALELENYKKFILDEANVKKIILDPNFSREAKVKVDILFEKAGKKFGKKLPEILAAIKSDNWQKLSNGSILAGNEILSPEDFSMKLVPSFEGENYESIGTDFLIILDTETDEKLEMEGLARDFIRKIQSQRKEEKFEVNDKITLSFSGTERFEKMIYMNEEYIKEQCLIEKFIHTTENRNFIFVDLEDAEGKIQLTKI